ncbi:MAG: GEVED domain-containing protein, partial [Bacteroidia bacterium]|nr:GEVED domain-containing protein [Bacteroidia bacterium]
MKTKNLLNLVLVLYLVLFYGTGKLKAQIISTNPAPYCTVDAQFANCGTNDFINNFTFHTLSNLGSGCNATAPYYTMWAQTTSVVPGNTYPMTVQGSATKPNGFGVWIDFNRDNDFFDANEFVYFTPGAYNTLPVGQLWTANITIPINATPGITRLRVRGNWANYRGGAPGGPFIQSEACGLIPDWTETEDYNITIVGSSGPVLPPIANFFPSQATTTTTPADTVWLNSPFALVSTSTNANRAFWDLPGENPLLPGYARGPVANTTQQYIDTAKYDSRFRYTYTRRGFWPVRLLAVSNVKRDSLRDSVVRYIYVDTPGTTPKPNFFAARRKVGIGDYASLVDITSGGPNQWFWTFDPPCNLCTTPP